MLAYKFLPSAEAVDKIIVKAFQLFITNYQDICFFPFLPVTRNIFLYKDKLSTAQICSWRLKTFKIYPEGN